MDEYDFAKRQTQLAFAARFGVPFTFIDEPFPASTVADSVSVPKTSKLRDQQIAWSELDSAFKAAWRRYVESH